MSKQIFLIRHAKSSWENPSLPDFERPLNTRGNNDAPMMAKRLIKRKTIFEHIIASPAKRAVQTAEHFRDVLEISKKHVIIKADLYMASVATFYNVIGDIDDVCESVAIVSHNPGITEFVNSLSNMRIDNMPTCGIFSVKMNIKTWKAFEATKKLFAFFDYPKNF